MNKPENSELYREYIELSIEIFQTQDRKAIEFLKNFLVVLPTQAAIAAVLTAALERLAQTDPEICRWIVRHPQYLMPELDLRALGEHILKSKLKMDKIRPGIDFFVDENAKIVIEKKAKQRLMASSNPFESIIIHETAASF